MSKRKVRRPKVAMSEKQIVRLKQEITHEATNKAILLATAAMADTLGLNDDQICEVASTINRWCEFLDDHLVKINDISDVIKAKTGIEFGHFPYSNEMVTSKGQRIQV